MPDGKNRHGRQHKTPGQNHDKHDHRHGHGDNNVADPQAPTSFGHGPVIPPSSSMAAPSLPLSILPISPSTGGQSFTTLTLPSTTFTFPLPSEDPSSTGFLTSSVLTSTASTAPSSVPSTPASPISITFVPPENTTSCDSEQVEWSLSDTTSPNLMSMTMDISVVSVPDNDVNLSITTGWPVLNSPFTWNPVSVSAGQYAFVGSWNGTAVRSPVFAVLQGSNTSCVTAGHGAAPINASSKSVNKGAIAGGTVGGLLLLACAVAGLFFLCGARKRNQRARANRSGWNGLNSMEDKPAHERGLEPGESKAYAYSDIAVAGHDTTPPTNKGSATSLDLEKTSPLSGSPPLPVLAHNAVPIELAHLPSRSPTQDTPRSSLDDHELFTVPPSRRASRTPRKPVPAYQPTAQELEVMAQRSSVSDVGHQPSTSPAASGASHDLLDGRPVHYLMPDPPPQPRA